MASKKESGPWEEYSTPQATDSGPWSEYAAKPKQQAADLGTQAQAGLQGFGQAATMGYLPQLQAKVGGLLPNPTEDVDQELEKRGFKINQPTDDYLKRRDEMIKRDSDLQKQAPAAYLGGQVGGVVASAVAPGAIAGRGAQLGRAAGLLSKTAPVAETAAAAPGLLKGVGQAALAGGVQGAVQNPGDTEGVIDPIQGQERLQNAKMGAALGGAVGVGSKLVSGAANKISQLPEKLRTYAQVKAFESAGVYKVKDYAKAAEKGKIGKLGQAMIDEGLVKPGSTFEDVMAKSKELRDASGQAIGDTYKKVAAHLESPEFLNTLKPEQLKKVSETALNTEQFSNELLSKFKKDLKGRAGSTTALNAIETKLGELAQNGDNANLASIQAFKQDLDGLIKYNNPIHQEPLTTEYYFKIRDYLKDKIQDRVKTLDEVLGKNALSELKEANQNYGKWAEIYDISKNRVNRENANQFFGLGDKIQMAGGIAHGGLSGAAMGAGAALAGKASRLYGKPLLVNAASGAANMLEKVPSAISQHISQGAGLLSNNPIATGSGASRLLNPPKNKDKK